MKLSARNVLRGTIRKIEIGAVNAELTLEIAPGVEVVSIITANSVERLNLFVDKTAYAVIKASSVMVGVD
jgi:molybdate transport system regulatory protein